MIEAWWYAFWGPNFGTPTGIACFCAMLGFLSLATLGMLISRRNSA